MNKHSKNYVIIDVRSEPLEFLDNNNTFVADFSAAKRMEIEEGTTIIDGFNKIGEAFNSNGKIFMPALIHIKNFLP